MTTFLSFCFSCAVYKTRCLAARALVAVVPNGNIPDMLRHPAALNAKQSFENWLVVALCGNPFNLCLIAVCFAQAHERNSYCSLFPSAC